MCDTVVATAEVTTDGVTVFGKNSDREPNEGHHLCHVSAMDHSPGSKVRCTYIEIPQVAHTFAVLLAKPFWIWGAEMGVNEHGVAIGNEAVFTKVPQKKDKALIGMDLLRLALERAEAARLAIDVIVKLLDQFGQGGNCGFQHEMYYHNSFIIADPGDAWVLETAGEHWAAKQIKGVYTISNGLTISNEWDLASPNLVSHAVQKGWCKGEADFDFAGCYSDFLYTRFSDSRNRCGRTTSLLSSHRGKITVERVMATLRDHGESARADWSPDKGVIGADVCMHAGFGPARASQSVGSMVSHLHSEHPTHFFTGTSAPCTSLFKPVWLDTGLPSLGPEPDGIYDEETLYWRHEALHRTTLRDYANFIQHYQAERDSLEAKFLTTALELAHSPVADRSGFAERCLVEADAAEARWLEKILNVPVQRRNNLLYNLAWRGYNRQAQMPQG